MRDYTRFINAVLENKLLRSSVIVEEFITKNQEEFSILKLKYKKIKKIVKMEKFPTLTGELDATYYQDKFNLSIKFQKNLQKKRSLYIDLNDAIKALINQMEIINKKIINLSEVFQDLSIVYKDNGENFDFFSNFSEYCKTLSNINIMEKKFFKTEVKEFFKYMRLELDEVDKLFSDYKYARINFEGCENNLISLKNNKISNNEENHQLELEQKKIEKDKAKRICCFLQNRSCDEYQRILELHKKRIKNLFTKISPNIIETYKKEYENLSKLINSFSN